MMEIIIKNSSGQPIYEQIYTQIKNLILSGGLKEGDLLPSIRGLAKDLRISVITTKRAYDELEREGYVNTVGGKGCFVAGMDKELIQEENLKKIESHIQEIHKLAAVCGITKEELIELFQLLEVET
jgi:GntR family transcriptional regulator